MTNDFGETRMYAEIATGTPYGGYSAKYAAEQLLIAVWRSELQKRGEGLGRGFVDEEGLFNEIRYKADRARTHH
jgi:hypothetical protein